MKPLEVAEYATWGSARVRTGAVGRHAVNRCHLAAQDDWPRAYQGTMAASRAAGAQVAAAPLEGVRDAIDPRGVVFQP